MAKSVCFYFQVHQPHRLRLYRFFDIGNDENYFDEFANRTILRKIADRCYLPANAILLDLIKANHGAFKVAFSISGAVMEQFERYAPDVIESFKALAQTGCVEFLAETYSHSLASLASESEFRKQVKMHSDMIRKYFGHRPKSFRNTELIYSDVIGSTVADMGYEVMLTEGARHILGWKSPNYIYTNDLNPRLKLLLKNFNMSDDIAFRFSNHQWEQWPLTSEKYALWLKDAAGDFINLFMDYETFGEHQRSSTGIFEFLKALPAAILSNGMDFKTPYEIANSYQPVAQLHVQYPISWADEERDTSAWLGNELQNEAYTKIYALENDVNKAADDNLTATYRFLQESDHFYYMCTKFFSDGTVHSYFNPYDSPYEAFINYMNVLSDFEIRVSEKLKENRKRKPSSKSEKQINNKKNKTKNNNQ